MQGGQLLDECHVVGKPNGTAAGIGPREED